MNLAQDAAKLRRYARVAETFTPGAPIDSLNLFAGRFEQILDVMNAVGQRGQHVVLYGERGVGKTSLANVLSDLFASRNQRIASVRVNCSTNDNFFSLWHKIYRQLRRPDDELEAWLDRRTTPDDVRYIAEETGQRTLIIIDELDRLDDDEALSLLADTIKTLSDHASPTSLVLVGVADSVDDLIGDHQSVERALVQVQMPRMSEAELTEIIDKGLGTLGMTIYPEVRSRIARLSEGLPHYTHLLALHATQGAVMDDRGDIQGSDVERAIQAAVEKAQHSIRSAYQKATRSPQKKHLYAEVLLACALAPKDELGYFTASGVERPMSTIMGKKYDIPAFAKHLNEFSDGKRGNVLQKVGTTRRFFYRFANPLLQPYVILNGLAKGSITEEVLRGLQGGDGSTPPIGSDLPF